MVPHLHLMILVNHVNPFTAKVSDLNCHPLEVVARYRDPQHQVGDNPFNHIWVIRYQPFANVDV